MRGLRPFGALLKRYAGKIFLKSRFGHPTAKVGLENTQSPCHDSEQQAPTKAQLFLTPEEVSKQLRVTAEQVRNLIRRGRISAVNVGAGKKRPLYRIKQQALDQFLDNSGQQSRSGPKKKFRRLPHGPDFFPDLR